MFTVGIYKSVGVTRKLYRLEKNYNNYSLDKEDRWETIEREAERIIKSLEKGRLDFYGDFYLPGNTPLGGHESWKVHPFNVK